MLLCHFSLAGRSREEASYQSEDCHIMGHKLIEFTDKIFIFSRRSGILLESFDYIDVAWVA